MEKDYENLKKLIDKVDNPYDNALQYMQLARWISTWSLKLCDFRNTYNTIKVETELKGNNLFLTVGGLKVPLKMREELPEWYVKARGILRPIQINVKVEIVYSKFKLVLPEIAYSENMSITKLNKIFIKEGENNDNCRREI